MKRLIKWLVILGVIGGIGFAAVGPVVAFLKERKRVTWRDAEATRGRIVAVVKSTGTVNPARSVKIGSFVSGPIESIYVDFNAEVKQGDLMAKIDPRIYDAAVARDRAALANQKATVEQTRGAVAASHQRREPLEVAPCREQGLHLRYGNGPVQVQNGRLWKHPWWSLRHQSIKPMHFCRTRWQTFNYTKIIAPVDGVVIDRKVDPGQTVAATFQTPELFTMGPDMRKEMRVFASVDEADIGLIRQA